MIQQFFINLFKILKGTALVLIFMAVATLVVLFVGGILWGELTYHTRYFLKGVGLLGAGLCIIYFLSKRYPDLFDTLTVTLSIKGIYIKHFFSTFFLSLIFFYIPFLIAGLLDLYTFVHFGIDQFDTISLIKHIIFVVVLTFSMSSIGEEVLFRGYLLNYFTSFLHTEKAALFISSIIFSIGHLHYQDWLNFLIAFCGGFVAGYTYLKFKTLLIPIAIHLSYNVFNFTIASDPGRGPQMPYIVKFDYSMIVDGVGAWVDLFIIMGFILLFVCFYLIEAPNEHKEENLVITSDSQ